MKVKISKFVFSVLICFSAGFIGSLFTFKNIPTWYAGLNKPSFSPPNYIFGPVWTLLYFMMGISLYLIILKIKRITSYPANVFLFHLVFNALWSIVFFGFKQIGMAFGVILILWYLIFYLTKAFYKLNKRAAYLLVPYLLWVTFASVLNFSVWYLNP